MNIKGVIFDFNGTLFFDNDKHVKAWGAISQMIRHHEISDEELHTHFNGVPNQQIIQYMLNNQATTKQLEDYSQKKEAYYRRFCQEDVVSFHLVEGALDYFDELLKKKIPFTIASASIKENIDFFIQSFNLDTWIEPKNIVYDNGNYANKIQMFKDVAQIINVDMQDMLVFEDSFSGIQNAYQAGCRHIIVVNSANKYEDYIKLPGVIKVINDFNEML